MLKIKDSVELKELEKFGFDGNVYYYSQIYKDELIFVHRDSRIIALDTMDNIRESLDVIYSLIKADLVEKFENV